MNASRNKDTEVYQIDYVAPYGYQVLNKYGSDSWRPSNQKSPELTVERIKETQQDVKRYFEFERILRRISNESTSKV